VSSKRQSELNNKLTEIKISGRAFDRGCQYGTKCKDGIAHFAKFIYESVETGKLPTLSSRSKLISHVCKHIPYIEEYSEELAQEMKGLAKGAGLSYEKIVMISLFEEYDLCTTFAATGQATVNGETYLGQSWDNIKNVGFPKPLLVNAECDPEPNYMAYTYPGLLAGAGLNSMGIGISWNTVPRLELKVGVPTYLIVAEILRQKTIGDAIDAVLQANRAGCFNFVLADESEVYDIEATPSDIDIAYHDAYMGHANHFVSEKFRERQDLRKVGAWSIHRHNRMNRILADHDGSIDLNVCMKALQDHVNYPNSICGHLDPAESNPWENFETEAAWVMVPAKREWWISYGPPCQNSFEKYVVG